MEFADISLGQREIIENIRKNHKHILLSHSFCTLFLWKETLKLKVYIDNDFFVVKYGLFGDNSYFFPCGNDDKKIKFVNFHINDRDFAMYYLRREDAEFLENHFPGKFIVNYDDCGSEYIFDRKEHIELSGGKYAKIRYEQNHLKSRYELSTDILNSSDFSVAQDIIDEWETKHDNKNSLYDDYIVAKNAIKFYNEMNLTGVLINVNGEPSAIVIGGEITEDTYSIQIAKMRTHIEGLIFYSLHECFKIIPEQYKMINGDDDMGVEGIRVHKKKMQPCHMNEVWKAVIK